MSQVSVRRFYRLLSILYIIGVVYGGSLWLGGVGLYGCPFKWLTGLPCGFCGATRCAVSVLQGDWSGVWRFNPLGLLLAGGAVLTPLWVAHDAWRRKPTAFFCARCAADILQRYWWVAMILLVANWLWTLQKGL